MFYLPKKKKMENFRYDSDMALLGSGGAYENGKTCLSTLAHNIYHITTRKKKRSKTGLNYFFNHT